MLSSFLVELAQVDASMLHHSYSLQSAAALYVAMRTFGKAAPYPRALAKHSGEGGSGQGWQVPLACELRRGGGGGGGGGRCALHAAVYAGGLPAPYPCLNAPAKRVG